ncbi:MAG: hypothetical protein IKS49_06070 [Actinomycetaceae bacterium]|nr:hypothetical protein [Actinomycetaceae bacterium]
MAKYRTPEGRVLSDADFDVLAKKADAGDYGTNWTVVRPQGRPRLSETKPKNVSVLFTQEQIAAMAKRLAKTGETRSQYLRRLVQEDLAIV